jgi:hypothetical protein
MRDDRGRRVAEGSALFVLLPGKKIGEEEE